MNFLFIDFYFSHQTTPGSNFNFWQLFNTVVGSLLGALVAYKVFLWNQKAADRREHKQRKLGFSDKLNYFKTFLLEIPPIVKRQSTLIDQLVRNIKANPNRAHSFSITEFSAMERFVDIKSHEYFLSSFLSDTTGQERQDRLRSFNSVYNKTQYYYRNILLCKEEFEKRQANLQLATLQYQKLIADADDFIANLYTNSNLQTTYPNVFSQVTTCAQAFRSMPDPRTYDHFITNLVTPMFGIIISLNGTIPEYHNLLLLLRAAKSNYDYMMFMQSETARIFQDYSTALNSEFDKYEGACKMIQSVE